MFTLASYTARYGNGALSVSTYWDSSPFGKSTRRVMAFGAVSRALHRSGALSVQTDFRSLVPTQTYYLYLYKIIVTNSIEICK